MSRFDAAGAAKTTHSILLVDDDPAVAQMFGLGLRAAGLDVVFARDGDIALAVASAIPFDLVLMDVQMPFVDGVEALRRLRSHRQTHDLPVVMLTNSDDESVRRLAWTLGITDWINKSRITPGELARYISAWLPPCDAGAPEPRPE